MKRSVNIIGSGFSGLAAASILGKAGYRVTVLEKNGDIGGRARVLRHGDYSFDMGPSWYWMPDIFEKYFSLFGKETKDYYQLKKLDPAFTIFFARNDFMDVPASVSELYELIDREEPNGAHKLKKFLAEAEIKYRLAVNELIYQPSFSILEFLKRSVIINFPKVSILSSYHDHVRRYFKNPRVIKLMEFPILFLGGTSRKTPALFSLMNYAAFDLSTWYPVGGFSKVIDAMKNLALEHGVEIKTNENVQKINVSGRRVNSLSSSSSTYSCDGIIAASDYVHTEDLLEEKYRNYNSSYWQKKILSPSCLIFYVGVNRKIKDLRHHNLFFDEELAEHEFQIYEKPQWPEKPLFYVCCTSKTDSTTAAHGHENLFILVPVASGLDDDNAIREKYFQLIINRIENIIGESFINNIDYKKSYCINDFSKDYNAYKGNAYGLATTLNQTAFRRPSMRNKKIKNMFYSGHLTVPGPGVPPALISGQIAAKELIKVLQ